MAVEIEKKITDRGSQKEITVKKTRRGIYIRIEHRFSGDWQWIDLDKSSAFELLKDLAEKIKDHG